LATVAGVLAESSTRQPHKLLVVCCARTTGDQGVCMEPVAKDFGRLFKHLDFQFLDLGIAKALALIQKDQSSTGLHILFPHNARLQTVIIGSQGGV